MGSRSIKNQLNYAVLECCAFGESKRAEKMNHNSDANLYKIYSFTYRDDMKDIAKALAKHVEETTKHKLVKDITTDDVQRFLDDKAKTARNTTLEKYRSQLMKLEQICRHVYKSKLAWSMADVLQPISAMPSAKVRDKAIARDVAEKIAKTMQENSRSDAYKSPLLSSYLGMRVEETSLIRAKAVRLSGGEFGLGEVAITDNIAKGGRDRIIPVIDKKTRDCLEDLIAGKEPMDFLIQTRDGENMQPANITNQFRKALVAMGLDKEYAHTKNHALRKDFAQRFYDMIRETKGKAAAIEATNRVLGHGAQRSVQELSAYVANMW